MAAVAGCDLFLSTLSLRRATVALVNVLLVLLISIHALLAESDQPAGWQLRVPGYFYPRSPCGERLCHAADPQCGAQYFYPRSPCGERQGHSQGAWDDIGDFYPRSPCGERRVIGSFFSSPVSFLSTLSLRRATCHAADPQCGAQYFYPRSPCGERRATAHTHRPRQGFLSTLSLRRATASASGPVSGTLFLSTLSLRRATVLYCSCDTTT